MFGLMQDWPLLCNRILDHAATYNAERQVITRSIEGPLHTTNYADLRKRALRVSQRLEHRDLGKPHLAGRRRRRRGRGDGVFGERRIGFLGRGKFLRQSDRGRRAALGPGVLGLRHQRQLRPRPRATA